MNPLSLLTTHNYDNHTSPSVDQWENLGGTENLGSMSTTPCVCSRQADYGHMLIPPIQAEARNAGSRHTSVSLASRKINHVAKVTMSN